MESQTPEEFAASMRALGLPEDLGVGPSDSSTTAAAIAEMARIKSRQPAPPLPPAAQPPPLTKVAQPVAPPPSAGPAPVQAPDAQTASAAAALRPAPTQPQATSAGEVDMPSPVIPRGIDPAIRSQAMREAAMAHAVHGLADRTTVTPFDVRQGVYPKVNESPVADAAQAMALQPLQEEQARAAHEQSVADTLNKFQQTRAALSSKVQLGKMLEEGRLGSAQIAAGGRQGVADTRAKNVLDLEAMRGPNRLQVATAGLAKSFALQDHANEIALTKKAIAEGGFTQKDSPIDVLPYHDNATNGADAAAQLGEILKDPEATSLTNGNLTWGQIRATNSPLAQSMAIQNARLVHAMNQASKRKDSSFSGGALAAQQVHLGDDAKVDANSIAQLQQMFENDKKQIEGSKPKWDWANGKPLPAYSPTPTRKALGLEPPASTQAETVRVVSPTGAHGTIPKAKLQEKLKQGYKLEDANAQ